MSKRIWLDTNVVLDVILEREGFVEEASELFLLHQASEIEIFISTLSLANIAFVVKKFGRNPFVVVSGLLKWINVTSLERVHFEKTVNSSFRDFEDGLQYFSSLNVRNIEAIITRNKADFKASKIPVLTPKEFLKIVSL
ncbi:MAG: type II toxin-antitoxin system VapC family toxin [Flammeovirgaceae bacterium]